MQQRSLFPDGFEVQERALAALRNLDVQTALQLVRQARKIDPRLVDLDALEAALFWLDNRLVSTPDAATLADVLRSAAGDAAAGHLVRAALTFIDGACARWLHQHRPATPFLDPEQCVPTGVIDLLLGNAAAARNHLLPVLDLGRGDQGSVLGYLGDAAWITERAVEANAFYVRALLHDRGDFDLVRVRHDGLRALHDGLVKTHGEGARGRLLVEAWLAGVLQILPRNGWLPTAQLDALLATAGGDPVRTFTLLLYADRTQSDRGTDVERRERMAELWPDAFQRFIATCRTAEQGRR